MSYDLAKRLIQAILHQIRRIPFLAKTPAWLWGLITLGVFVTLLILSGGTGYAPGPAASSGSLDTLILGVSVVFKLSLVVALIYLAAYLLRLWRGFLPGKQTQRLAIRETVRLSPRQALHLVQVGEQVFLIGATDQNLSLLAHLEALLPEDMAQPSEQYPHNMQPQAPSFFNLMMGFQHPGHARQAEMPDSATGSV